MYSLIIPVFNEEKSILDVLVSCEKQLRDVVGEKNYEILVIDDGSTDGSAAVVETRTGRSVRLIRHGNRRGVGAARTTGVQNAVGKVIMFIDADMTYDAADFKPVIAALANADMVVGARTVEKGTLRFMRSGIKSLFCFLAGRLTQTHIPDLNSGLRAMSRDITQQFLYLLPQGHSWVSTITLCFLASSYRVAFVPISYHTRRGRSSFHIVRDTYLFFMTIIKTIVYFYPLRVLMPVSFTLAGGGCVFLVRDLLQRNIADTTILLLVAALIMFVFALLSEQLACLRRELNQKLR